MIIKTLSACALAVLLAAGAQAEIYKYRNSNGKLIISNTPPPEGADIESQHKSAKPRPGGSAAYVPPPAPGASESFIKQPRLIDRQPLEVGETRVEPTTTWWKQFVRGSIKNRSGISTAHGVVVKAACHVHGRLVDTGTAELGDIGPRDERFFAIPIDIPGSPWHGSTGRLSCHTTYGADKISW